MGRPEKKRAHTAAFSRLYADWIQDSTRYPELVYREKRLIMQVSLSSELHMLAHVEATAMLRVIHEIDTGMR